MDAIRKLNTGAAMPTIGFGTFQIKEGKPAYDAVAMALKAGYRHIDTAAVYGNEQSVGKAIRDSGLPREEVFLTTKLWNDDIRSGDIERAFKRSLDHLGTNYVDLYLVHWPAEGYEKAWPVMEKLYDQGNAKAIGVSNFHIHHIGTLMEKAMVVPALNQIECHPYLNQAELRGYCTKLGVQCESWSPLGGKGGKVLGDPTIKDIADRHGKSPAQIVLRWNVQIGSSVDVRSEHEERIRQNLDVFTFSLDDADMKAINSLDRNQRFGPDPDNFSF